MAQSSKVINGTEYSNLATKYGSLLNLLKSATSYMYDALVLVANFTKVEPTRDLIVPFDSVYQQQVVALASSTQFQEIARALNNHVLSRARTAGGATYSDLNTWFADQEIDGFDVGFPQSWADMSKLVGQNIDIFIEDND